MNCDDEINLGVRASITEIHRHPQCLTWIDPLSRKKVITDDPILREFLVEIVSRIPYEGLPKLLPTPKGRRGRKIKRTQYNLAHERRKAIYQILVGLQKSRGKAADERRKIGKSTQDLIQRIAILLEPKTPRYKLAIAICNYLEEHPKLPQHNIKTVRKHLNKIRPRLIKAR